MASTAIASSVGVLSSLIISCRDRASAPSCLIQGPWTTSILEWDKSKLQVLQLASRVRKFEFHSTRRNQFERLVKIPLSRVAATKQCPHNSETLFKCGVLCVFGLDDGIGPICNCSVEAVGLFLKKEYPICFSSTFLSTFYAPCGRGRANMGDCTNFTFRVSKLAFCSSASTSEVCAWLFQMVLFLWGGYKEEARHKRQKVLNKSKRPKFPHGCWVLLSVFGVNSSC